MPLKKTAVRGRGSGWEPLEVHFSYCNGLGPALTAGSERPRTVGRGQNVGLSSQGDVKAAPGNRRRLGLSTRRRPSPARLETEWYLEVKRGAVAFGAE